MKLRKDSNLTGRTYHAEIDLTEEEYHNGINSGKLIQEAFPKLGIEQREFIKTGFSYQEQLYIFNYNAYLKLKLQDYYVRLMKLSWAMNAADFKVAAKRLQIDAGFNHFCFCVYGQKQPIPNLELVSDFDNEQLSFFEHQQNVKKLIPLVEEIINSL